MKLSSLDKYQEIVIQMHDNPDADAIGSGYSLYKYFESKGKKVRLVYGGKFKITKSNIVLLMEELKLPVEYVTSLDCPELLITVDSQYGEGNVQKFEAQNVAIIDHHNTGRISDDMAEIRSHIVSCSTICYDMIKKEGFDINKDMSVATTLYYGLYMDSNGFSEIRHPLERDMIDFLRVDKGLIKKLMHSNFTIQELETAGIALLRYSFDENKHVSIIKSKPCDPNILGLIGDLVLQVDSIDVCVIYNECPGGYKLSVRSCIVEVAANDLASFITEGIGNGGGHNDKAGGYVNAIFSAYQREDTRLKIMTVRYIIQYALQIVILAVFANYYLYLITLPLMVIPNSLSNYYAAKKQYPEITCVGTPSKEIQKSVYHRVKTLFAHKVGNTMLVNVDSILISAYLGLFTQSVYSNYYYIHTAVNGVVEIITNGCLAGIGNKLIVDSEEDNHRMFLNLSYGWVALIGFCAACMLCLYQPFIGAIWIGEHGLLEQRTVVLLVIMFYTWMFRLMQLTYRDAAGLWTKDWLKPLIAMAVKLISSVILVQKMQSIDGALIPTIVIMLVLYFPWEAQILYRNIFHRSWKGYLRTMVKYTVMSALGAAISWGLCVWVAPENSVATFFIRLAIICVVFPLVWVGCTFRTEEFRYCLNRIKGMTGFGRKKI